MNTLTQKQFIVEILINKLSCEPSSYISKAVCYVHYGQNSMKLRTQPRIGVNGIANFKKQTICLPYSDQIKVSFKRNYSSKKQMQIGYYCIDVRQYLQRNVHFVKLNQKLKGNQAWLNFQCKIIDRNTYNDSETQDLSDRQSVLQRSKYTVLDNEPQTKRKYSNFQSQSQINAGHSRQRSSHKRDQSILSNQQLQPLAQQQFGKKIEFMSQILRKMNFLEIQHQKLQLYTRNRKGQLKTQMIRKLENLLKQKNQEITFNKIIIYVSIGVISFFAGLMVAF